MGGAPIWGCALTPSQVCVILVDPEQPRNIGFVARAMKCFGVSELRIVSERFLSMHSSAYITGTSAKRELDDAKFYTELDEALQGCEHAVAFSRRNFEWTSKEYPATELAERVVDFQSVALVFGRESQGLFGDEIAKCNSTCYIPAVDGMSFNLGQAASLGLYEAVGRQREVTRPRDKKSRTLATRQELAALAEHLLGLAPHYFGDLRKGAFMRRLVERIQPTRQEVKLLFGMTQELVKGAKHLRATKKKTTKSSSSDLVHTQESSGDID